jgi:hypothetical protein
VATELQIAELATQASATMNNDAIVMNPAELRARGFEVLVRALGWVNAVRFIQQNELSGLNYTAERDRILPNWDAAQMVQRMSAPESAQ